MLRYLPIVLEIALLVYALIDLMQTDNNRVRNLPKLVWALLVVFIPFLGPLAWFFAGRPQRQAGRGPGEYQIYEAPRPVAPDDDPEFLKSLQERARDADLFKKWEDDLRRREQEFKNKDAEPPAKPDEPDVPRA